MNTRSTRRAQILASLADFEYRHALVEEHLAVFLPFQLRAMREERGWTQGELGVRCGKAQEWICKLENPNYGRFSLQTLKTLARAFDVALEVRFRPFSYFVDWMMTNRTSGDIDCTEYSKDSGLVPVVKTPSDGTNIEQLAMLYEVTSGKKQMVKAGLSNSTGTAVVGYAS